MKQSSAAKPRLLRPLLVILVIVSVVFAVVMYRQRRVIAAYFGSYPGQPALHPNGHPTERGTLFIGNSLTYFNDLPATIQYFSDKAGDQPTFEYGQETRGGATLGWHWSNGHAVARVKKGTWTHVVLQDLSTMPLEDPESMAGIVQTFHQEIKAHGAQTVLFMTWAWKDTPGAQEKVSHVYNRIGKELGIPVVPVGRAWELSQKEKPLLSLYCDERHPNPAGTYLAACVFYGFMYHRKPTGITTKVPWLDVSENDAVFLQEIATKALLEAGLIKE